MKQLRRCVSEPSLDADAGFQLLHTVVQSLVRGGVLNDQLCFPVDCEDKGMTGVPHLG